MTAVPVYADYPALLARVVKGIGLRSIDNAPAHGGILCGGPNQVNGKSSDLRPVTRGGMAHQAFSRVRG